MAQMSRPWAGTVVGDAGPYTAPNWWDVWQSMGKGNGALVGAGNRGVYARVPGRLEVTYVGPNFLSVAAGAALIDGMFYVNDTAYSVTVTSATAGNVRDDLLVVRKYFSTLNQTARLVLLPGSESASPGPGTPPALIQDTARLTYWDIPLAQVSITDAGVITLTDLREYIDAAVKRTLYPAEVGWNSTDSVNVFLGDLFGLITGVLAEDNHKVYIAPHFIAPNDAVLNAAGTTFLQASLGALISNLGAAGNIYMEMYPYISLSSAFQGDIMVHDASMCDVGFTAEPVTKSGIWLLKSCDVTTWNYARRMQPGRFVHVLICRDATDPLDTLGGDIRLIGAVFDYLAYL